MTALQYSQFYGVDLALLPIMELLNPKDYYFLRVPVKNKEVIVNTGWYSGSGAYSKRQSIAPKLIVVAEKCGFKAYKFQDGGRGAKYERVKIIL